jgi:anti-sigma-K factor RskA
MIDEAMELQARLYARGLLSAEERQQLEAALQQDAHLRDFVAGLRASPLEPGLWAGFEPLAPASEAFTEPTERFERGGIPYWLPWILAASLAVISVLLLTQGPPGNTKLAELQQRLDEAEQLNSELKGETETLQRAIEELKRKDPLAGLQIINLGPRATASPATATVAWVPKNGKGLFLGWNLPSPPASHQLQLWAGDQAQPAVNAGRLRPDDQGHARLEFTLPGASAPHFFVTLEPVGDTAQVRGAILLSSE